MLELYERAFVNMHTTSCAISIQTISCTDSRIHLYERAFVKVQLAYSRLHLYDRAFVKVKTMSFEQCNQISILAD